MGMDPAAETPGSMAQIGAVARLGDLQLLQPTTVEGLQALRQEALPQSVIGSLLDAPPSEGDGTVERGALSCPIAPSSAVSDAQVFTDPNDSTKSYVLPRYAVDQSSGGPVAVRFGSDGDGWSLTVDLVRTYAPEIAGSAATAAELPHVFTVTLRFQLPAGGASGVLVELPFQEVTESAGGLHAVLRITDGGRRDQVYLALTEVALGAQLVVGRTVTVAYELPPPSPVRVPSPDSPGPKPWESPPIIVRPPEAEVVPEPDPRAGLTAIETNAADLTVSAEMPVTTVLDGAEVAREWRRPPIWGGPIRVPPASPPRYRVVTVGLDWQAPPVPFVFPPETNPAVFQGVAAPGASTGPSLSRVEVANHGYYQDPTRPWVFYYLPDAFKLARNPVAPHRPMMRLSFAGSDQAPDQMQVTVAFFTRPWTDPDRLSASLPSLAAHVGAPFPPGVSAPQLEPLIVDPSVLSLQPPIGTANGPGSATILSLRDGASTAAVLPMHDFVAFYQGLFDAGTGPVTQLTVGLNAPGRAAETVPVLLDANDTVGPLVDSLAVWDPSSLAATVTLRNPTEATVTVTGLQVALGQRPGDSVSAVLSGPGVPGPLTLHPGDTTQLVAAAPPSWHPDPSAQVTAVVQQTGLSATVDESAFFQLVLDRTARTTFTRTVQVSMLASTFQTLSDGSRYPKLVQLDANGADSLQFSASDKPDQAGSDLLVKHWQVGVPLDAYLLGHPDSGAFQYTVTVLWSDNTSAQSGPRSAVGSVVLSTPWPGG